jgi:hypothetical protein
MLATIELGRRAMTCATMAMMNWKGRGSIEDGHDASRTQLLSVCVEMTDRARIALP